MSPEAARRENDDVEELGEISAAVDAVRADVARVRRTVAQIKAGERLCSIGQLEDLYATLQGLEETLASCEFQLDLIEARHRRTLH